MVTVSKEILVDSAKFMLWNIYTDEGELYQSPILSVLNIKDYNYNTTRDSDYSVWDNSEYILRLFKDLKKGRKAKKSKQIRDLKNHCEKLGWNFKETKEELLELYKESKKHFTWKIKKK